MDKITIRFKLLFLLTILAISGSIAAKEISIQLPNSLHAFAEYTEGSKDKPAVLILHGILQTHNFSTIQRIGDHLAESGYTTLRPTISLGIDSRKKSMACEAIHAHTMDADIEEIAQWVEWLKEQTNQPIILIGHSLGAGQLIAYLDKYKDKHEMPERLILVSLAYFGNRPNSNATKSEIEKARRAITNGKLGPSVYGFTYCKDYVAPPEAYLSYFDWDQQRITDGLKEIQTQTSLLFGSGDKRIDQTWPIELKEMGMDVYVVDDADHFFHGDHEFDLLDFIDEVVAS